MPYELSNCSVLRAIYSPALLRRLGFVCLCWLGPTGHNVGDALDSIEWLAETTLRLTIHRLRFRNNSIRQLPILIPVHVPSPWKDSSSRVGRRKKLAVCTNLLCLLHGAFLQRRSLTRNHEDHVHPADHVLPVPKSARLTTPAPVGSCGAALL